MARNERITGPNSLEAEWREQMGAKYEQFLFRDGAMNIDPNEVITYRNNYISLYHFSAEDHKKFESNLHWARRFNGLVPKNWWDPIRFGFYERFRPDKYGQIFYDFQVAGALGFQLSRELIDGGVSLDTLAPGLYQMLDSEQLAMLFFEECKKRVVSDHREFLDTIAHAQEERGVARSVIDLGLETYRQLCDGTIAPQRLEQLRTRFVPEYLPHS